MKKLHKSILENISDCFDKTSTEFKNIDKGIDLFLNIAEFETGNKSFDGLSELITNALSELFVEQKISIAPLKLLADSLEPFFKKVLLLKDEVDYSTNRTDLIDLMKELNLNKKLSNPAINPPLTPANLQSYKNEPEYLFYLCKVHIIRNEVHNSPKWNLTEILENAKSLIIIYLYTTIKYFHQLNPFVSKQLDENIKASKYKNFINSVLATNHSIKLLQSDFGVQSVSNIEDFEIKIRARQKEKKKERDEYLKDKHLTLELPFKLLPDIDVILTSKKFYLLHGIATSGKSTLLRKIGKLQLIKDKNSFVFFLELGKCYECNTKKPLLEELKMIYRKITELDFDFSKNKHKILILLDGLDEVANQEIKDFIISDILQLKQNPLIQIILTSRSNDYVNNNKIIDSIFEKYELLPLNPNEMVSIAEKIIDNSPKLDSFIKFIKKSEVIKAFPKTPFTTILLAIIFKEKEIDVKELPKNITELYRKIIDIFIVRWDKSRGISEQFKVQQKELVLQKLAVYLHSKRQIAITSDELEDFVKQLSSVKTINGADDPNNFIKNLSERTNIFIKNEFDNTYQFFHLTIQEYLASLKFNHKDDDNLVANFYDEWWLNPNIFYAGKDPEYPDILQRVADFEIIPIDVDSKINYIIHSSKVLLAAHSIDNPIRNKVLRSMIKMYNEFITEFIKEISSIEQFSDKIGYRAHNKTLLDMILFSRDFFMEFFSAKDFSDELLKIWNEYLFESPNKFISDITLYSLSYCLSLRYKDAKYLEEFVINKNFTLDVRWFKIVDVDINIKKLTSTDKKSRLKIKSKAQKNNDYIQKQFKERIAKHYKSITGFENNNKKG